MKILVAGDFCPRKRVASIINADGFSSVLGDVKKSISEVDYAIVNLECPVVEHQETPIEKCGPNLSCTCNSVEALKWAGFSAVTLANNHFLDYGENGVRTTLAICSKYGLDTVGGGTNLKEASQVLFKEVCGIKLAFINCCEHEFSIATEKRAGSNPLNIVQQYYAIKDAQNKADIVIVIVHGGVEHFWLPTERMMETYRFFVNAGADAVINHHQHCYSGFEIYKRKPIFYGLGNFCFDGDSQNERWTSGYMVTLVIDNKKEVGFELLPYRQCTTEPSVCLMEGGEKEAFIERIKGYNTIIADKDINRAAYEQWCSEHENIYKSALNPLYNRFTAWFFDGIIGRKLIGKKKWLFTKDNLVNESHIERIRMVVEQYIEKSK